MGLIKAAGAAIKGELKDQFLKPITCEDMGNEILMRKVTTENGVIPNGSRIIVAPGQVAALYDNGRILDATAEAGTYEFKTEASPSFFGGDFGPVFKDMWERFKFGGAIAKEQAVFYFNTKEILDNKFGTQNPIPYRDWGHPLTNPRTNTLMPMSVEIKCFGKYTFKIIDPAKFMMEISGTRDSYTKAEIIEQIRAEVVAVFQNVTNSLGEDDRKIAALSLPSQTDEIRELMDEQVFDEPIRNRGMKLETFVVESVTLTEDSKEKIDKYELGSDTYQQKATMTEAYASAVEKAAENSGGAFNGFMGIGVANMSMGNPLNGVANATTNPNPVQTPVYDPKIAEPVKREENVETKVSEPEKQENLVENTENNLENKMAEPENTTAVHTTEANETKTSNIWTCECGQQNHGNFCMKCGKKKPVQEEKENICPNCKEKYEDGARFCSNCGEKLS